MALNKRTKSILRFSLLLVLAALLVWLAFRPIAGKQDQILPAFKTANYFWVGMSVLASLLSHLIRAYRWKYLLEPLGYSPRFINSSAAVFIGYLLNYGLPRMGEISRCTLISRKEKVPFEAALGTVITERIVDTLLVLIVFVLTLMVQFKEIIGLCNHYIFDPLKLKLQGFSQSPGFLIITAVILLTIVLFFYLIRKRLKNLFQGKFGTILKGFGKGLLSVKEVKNKFMFIVLSFAIWGMYLLGVYLCFFALKGTAHLGISEGLVLLLFGTFGVIFTPGGIGAYHAIVTGVLVYYKIDEISAFAYPWLVWTSQFLLIVLMGSLSLLTLLNLNKKKDVISQQA